MSAIGDKWWLVTAMKGDGSFWMIIIFLFLFEKSEKIKLCYTKSLCYTITILSFYIQDDE